MRDDTIPHPSTAATRTIHVVVTCTDRKTREPNARARDLPRGRLLERFAAWQAALAEAAPEALPIEALYSGDHWQVVRSLPASAPPSARVRVWVCSAGVGLAELGTSVCSYSATFGPEHADSVAPRGCYYSASDWWGALSEWHTPGTTCRSISEIARIACGPRDLLLVALSAQYLGAVYGDAQAAAGILGERFSLLSVGARPEVLRRYGHEGRLLAERLLPADARLKTLVGGAMQSLNARLARRAVQEADAWADTPARLVELLAEWTTEAPAAEVFDRTRGNDLALRAFIRDALRENPTATYTGLLRALRGSGRACEQSRFRTLFEIVAAEGDCAGQVSPREAEA